MDLPLTKPEWTDEVYRLLCVSQGVPTNEGERQNLLSLAEAMAEEYYLELVTPEEAHAEELSHG